MFDRNIWTQRLGTSKRNLVYNWQGSASLNFFYQTMLCIAILLSDSLTKEVCKKILKYPWKCVVPFWGNSVNLCKLKWRFSRAQTMLVRMYINEKGLAGKQENPLWLWNPWQTSPEVQNMGISCTTKKTYVLQNFFKKTFSTSPWSL